AISARKAGTEVPSPGSGIVSQILVQEGETVEVGTKLAVITPDGAQAEAPAEAPPEPATQEAAREVAAAAPVETMQPTEPEPAPAAAAEPAPTEPSTPEPQRESEAADANGRAFVSPVVARIAAEHNVDVSKVSGTGAGGRVTKKDILAFIESGPPAEAAAPAEAATPVAPQPPPAAP